LTQTGARDAGDAELRGDGGQPLRHAEHAGAAEHLAALGLDPATLQVRLRPAGVAPVEQALLTDPADPERHADVRMPVRNTRTFASSLSRAAITHPAEPPPTIT